MSNIDNQNIQGPEFDEESNTDETFEYPFNPDDISIDKKNLLVDTCVKRLVQNTIVMSPDFQRHEVWDDGRKSRLIESLMLKIPIPMFYVSADERSVLTVVDGLQRLSALRDFVLGKTYLDTHDEKYRGNGIRLKGLEFWTKYEGKTFAELPIYLQNRITETELTFTIINPGTPEEVKRNIFKRINTGGLFLTPQEIRNALYTGKATKLLYDLSQTEEFLQATARSVNPARMEDMELVLRCIAFILRPSSNYPKTNSMDNFLSDTMLIINGLPNLNTSDLRKLSKDGHVDTNSIKHTDINTIIALFKQGMSRSYQLFGHHCFRRSRNDQRRSPINKALFEMWGSILATLNFEEFSRLEDNFKAFISEYYIILDDIDFQNSISRDSWKMISLQRRFDRIERLVYKYTGENYD